MQTDNLQISLAREGSCHWLWVQLCFSSFYFLPVLFGFKNLSILTLAFSLIIYVLFVVAYFKAAFSPSNRILWPLLSIVLIATFGAGVNPGTNVLFGFATFFCGFCFPAKKAWVASLGILLCQFVAVALFKLDMPTFLVPGSIVSIGLFLVGYSTRKERIHQLKEARSQAQVEQMAAIAERERIARDLHDTVGHSLSAIALKAELAAKLSRSGKLDEAATEIDQVAQLSREALSEVRQTITGFKSKGLQHEFARLTRQLSERSFVVHGHCQPGQIDAKLESTLILILKEAVTNIMRHSSGDSVTIAVNQNAGRVTMSIADNGGVTCLADGNGLSGIAERCAESGGSFTTDIANGVKLLIALPCDSEA